jgi:hypothetical protein
VPHWQLLLKTSASFGLLLSLALTVVMIVSFALAPEMWVGDYPPDVKARYGPMTPRSARLRPYVAFVFFLVVLVVPVVGLFTLQAQVASVPFLPALAFAGVTLLVFNLFDLLILDWLLFCTIRPRWLVLPGTEGMAGYRDYRFHLIGFIKGLGFCIVGGLIVSLVWLAIQGLTS